MKKERMFRFIGNPEEYTSIQYGKIYSENIISGSQLVTSLVSMFPEDFQEVFENQTYQELSNNILDWAKEKDLLKPDNQLKQYAKIFSEVGELGDALIKLNHAEIIDAIGDIQVCLIILCAQLRVDSVECLESSYQVIKKRTGKTINGTFIKD